MQRKNAILESKAPAIATGRAPSAVTSILAIGPGINNQHITWQPGLCVERTLYIYKQGDIS